MSDRPTTTVHGTDAVRCLFSLINVTPLHEIYNYLTKNTTKIEQVDACIMWAAQNNRSRVGTLILLRIGVHTIDLNILTYFIYCMVKLDNPVILSLLLSDKRIYDDEFICTKIIRDATESAHVRIVQLILADRRINPNNDIFSECCVYASEKGHAKIVQLLLCDGRADPGFNSNHAIHVASVYGHVEIMRLLLADKRVNPDLTREFGIYVRGAYPVEATKLLVMYNRDLTAKSSDLHMAIISGNHVVINVLLGDKRFDPSVDSNAALCCAVRIGYLNAVRLLLADTRVDPTATGAVNLILLAILNRYSKILTVLLSDPRIIMDKLIFRNINSALKKMPAASIQINTQDLRQNYGDEYYSINKGISKKDNIARIAL